MEALSTRSPNSSNENLSILEELLVRGMAPNDVTTMVIDMLMAGIDTVSYRQLTSVNY